MDQVIEFGKLRRGKTKIGRRMGCGRGRGNAHERRGVIKKRKTRRIHPVDNESSERILRKEAVPAVMVSIKATEDKGRGLAGREEG